MAYNYKYVPRTGADLTDEEFNEIAKMISEILVFLRKKHGSLSVALVLVCATAYGTKVPGVIAEITGLNSSSVRNILKKREQQLMNKASAT